jgi:hypothetical protein
VIPQTSPLLAFKSRLVPECGQAPPAINDSCSSTIDTTSCVPRTRMNGEPDSFDKVGRDETSAQRQNAFTQNRAQQLASGSGRDSCSLVHDEIINGRIDRCYLLDWLPGWLRIVHIIAAAGSGSEISSCRRHRQKSHSVEPGRVLDCQGNLVAAAKGQGKSWLQVAVT